MKTSKLTFWRTLKSLATEQWVANAETFLSRQTIRRRVVKDCPVCEVANEILGGDRYSLRYREAAVVQDCPVCAVANEILGGDRYSLRYPDAAKEIGLDPVFASNVAQAADIRLHPDKIVRGIRKQLKRVLGL